ncbi:MAG: hypothetical protein HQL24_09555 [Candidatus Omnitrophica bacterium]|nr:hypothetical protein [Candidatus Omnitrophota bacterium]
MFKYLNKKRGQSTLEYAILVIIIIGALLSIQTYIKRGIQGRLKSATDDIGDQYSPGNTNVVSYTTTVSNTTESNVAGQASTNMRAPEVTTSNMTSKLLNTQQEYWGGK